MRLDEVHVERYGPLREHLTFGDGATVVYGPNESGKTLLVEYLLRSLTADAGADGSRVAETPEGYVVVEAGGEEHELDGETLLDRFERRYDFELTPAEFRNVFVVRDGDLRIADEDAFYQRVTDRIVGIWTGDIETVREAVLERGRVTPLRMELSSQYDEADEQLELARELRDDVDAYLDRAADEEFETLQRERYLAHARREEAEREVAELEAAKARHEYEELVRTKGTLETSLEERAALPDPDRLTELEARVDDLDAGSEEDLERRERWYRRATLASLLAGLVAFAVPVGLGVRSVPLLAAGPAVFAVVAVAALVLYRSANAARAALSTERESILADAAELGIEAYGVADVSAAIAETREERESHTEVVRGNTEVLRTWLDIEAEAPREVVAAAEDRLATRKTEVDPTVDREFTEEALETARERAAAARERYRERRDALEAHRRRLAEFADRADRLRFETFVGEQLDLAVTNVDALEDLRDALDEFVATVETDADVSRAAATVLADMAESETEKMTTLFADGTAGDLFTKITDDRYVDVGLTDDSELAVELATGRTLSPADLSRGARDQLYLAVRVALGRRLLDGEEGFFLLDDAFLSAGPDRLARQAEVVCDLVDDGWQVVYLTCKPDARDALADVADAEVLELSPL